MPLRTAQIGGHSAARRRPVCVLDFVGLLADLPHMPHIARQLQHVRPGLDRKVGLEVMPIASVTLSEEHGPKERAPTAVRYADSDDRAVGYGSSYEGTLFASVERSVRQMPGAG